MRRQRRKKGDVISPILMIAILWGTAMPVLLIYDTLRYSSGLQPTRSAKNLSLRKNQNCGLSQLCYVYAILENCKNVE